MNGRQEARVRARGRRKKKQGNESIGAEAGEEKREGRVETGRLPVEMQRRRRDALCKAGRPAGAFANQNIAASLT